MCWTKLFDKGHIVWMLVWSELMLWAIESGSRCITLALFPRSLERLSFFLPYNFPGHLILILLPTFNIVGIFNSPLRDLWVVFFSFPPVSKAPAFFFANRSLILLGNNSIVLCILLTGNRFSKLPLRSRVLPHLIKWKYTIVDATV